MSDFNDLSFVCLLGLTVLYIQPISIECYICLNATMSRVLKIGTDLHKRTRFTTIITKSGGLNTYKTKRLSQRILNPYNELPTFNHLLQSNELEKCSTILSSSWCVKESIYKTLDVLDQRNFKMSDWYKFNDADGRPLIGNDSYFAEKQNEEFLLSLSHDGDYIISTVLRQKK